VLCFIENLSGKAISEYCIPTKVVKLYKFVLVPVLTCIFNKCINEGFYPDCFRPGLCLSTNLKNKIFTQIIDQYLFYYCSVNSIWHSVPLSTQISVIIQISILFRPKSATACAVESVSSNLLSNADIGLYFCSVCIDLSKAFDTVNHNLTIW